MDKKAEYRHILEYIHQNPECSSKAVFEGMNAGISYASVKRYLMQLLEENRISTSGKGRNTRYYLSPGQQMRIPVDIDAYFSKETDERTIRKEFHYELIHTVLPEESVFTAEQLNHLNHLQHLYLKNIERLTPAEILKELNRWAIDLSWKSSQIEGNTYSLLETERLLTESITTSGKTKEEAIMLLNHKAAIQFIIENPDYLSPLQISGIEDIHKLLVKELDISVNIRTGRIGISGTNFRPIDNEHQIREALHSLCTLIQQKTQPFEKAFLALILISYIQPFADGNKRTSRIVCNALLMQHGHCPLSFRTVDSLDYKKAMVLFYEQNNITAMKKIFIEQVEFAVGAYF
jgi:Fic family protein